MLYSCQVTNCLHFLNNNMSNHTSKTVLVWTTKIEDLLEGKSVGGITVQLYFWSMVFKENEWKVFSLTKESYRENDGIHFLKKTVWHSRIEIIHEWFTALFKIISVKPEIVIFRGAQRELLPVSFWCKVFGIKLAFFSASDVNFVPGKEQVFGSTINLKMYRRSIKKIRYFIVQNEEQHRTLKQNYGFESLILSNIWGKVPKGVDSNKYFDVIWVGNMRKLKRPEWVLRVASSLPSYDFCIIGDSWGDEDYYNDIKTKVQSLTNVSFLGGLPFAQSDLLISHSKLLICTSEFEGFPNTFLQAWSHSIPVISTVNPNQVITSFTLGDYVESEVQLEQSISLYLNDNQLYSDVQKNIINYFSDAHKPQTGFEKLIKYIGIQ